MINSRLAFVDLETSGLSPARDRVTEIGVVTVDDGHAEEWTTLVNRGIEIAERARMFNDGSGADAVKDAPRFAHIAKDLAARLAGRIFIAHNARFDCGFLRAEFARAGIDFAPPVVCSVMLSRKLYPEFATHDLDALMARHNLTAEVRHRALPDARLVRQFWEVAHREHAAAQIEAAITALLAGPVLPAHLDPSLLDRLPDAPGVYVLHGDNGEVLHIGKASNLRRHLIAYFRIDRSSAKALAVSHQVRNITWNETRGTIGAYLKRAALADALASGAPSPALLTWRLAPDAHPCLTLAGVEQTNGACESYGLYLSERKARNALAQLATRHHLCRALLGVGDNASTPCTGCSARESAGCARKSARLKHLEKALVALKPLRVEAWPYKGPVGVRERSDLHVIDGWRYIGTARNESEVHEVMQTRAPYFDPQTFSFLARTLRRLPRRRIVALPPRAPSCLKDYPLLTADERR